MHRPGFLSPTAPSQTRAVGSRIPTTLKQFRNATGLRPVFPASQEDQEASKQTCLRGMPRDSAEKSHLLATCLMHPCRPGGSGSCLLNVSLKSREKSEVPVGLCCIPRTEWWSTCAPRSLSLSLRLPRPFCRRCSLPRRPISRCAVWNKQRRSFA